MIDESSPKTYTNAPSPLALPGQSALLSAYLSVIWQAIRNWANSAWFSYITLFLLQLKVVWGIWEYRDLTPGDTAGYFARGYLWFDNFLVDIIWSPLYTSFYGTLLYLSTDAYAVTILHRLIIVFSLTLLVLALMRRLLPHNIAWLVGVWWAILPINFDALYEVHLFAVIPALSAWLLILCKPSPWTRGGAIAILFGAAVLVRNELLIATVILAVICLSWEIRLARKIEGKVSLTWRTYLVSYGLPLLLAVLLCLFFYMRSVIQLPELLSASAPKHTVNMCQVYAFGYQQRHPEWKKNPWTECYELIAAHFGQDLLSLSEMLQRNPSAILENILWNISLTPNGIQVLLFNATSGTVSPDYVPVHLRSFTALILSIITAGILILGLFLLYRERHYWWKYWLQERVLGWLAMLSVIAVAGIIIPTQRPRPSYLFTLSIFLMALTGMSVFVITYRRPGFQILSNWMPVVMVVTLLATPIYYVKPNYVQSRHLLNLYRKLTPFEKIISRDDTIFLVNGYSLEVHYYIRHRYTNYVTKTFDYSIFNGTPLDISLPSLLNERGINLFYVDENFLGMFQADPYTLIQTFLSSGWKLIAYEDGGDGRWMLLYKPPKLHEDVERLQQLNTNPDIGPALDVQALYTTHTLPTDGLFIGHGWYPIETFAGETFRWVNNDAEIVVTAPSGNQQQLNVELEPGPGLASQPFELQVLDKEGQIVATTKVSGRETVIIKLTIVPNQPAVFRLHVESSGLPTSNDPRILNFRVFRFGWSEPH